MEKLFKDRVLPEVINLVEWPKVLNAELQTNFSKLLKSLISEMVEHQRYFPVIDSNGSLKNLFIITANNKPSDQIRKWKPKSTILQGSPMEYFFMKQD